MRLLVIICIIAGLHSTHVFASDWYTLVDWETAMCVESDGPIKTGPIAELYECQAASDENVLLAVQKTTGKIGGIYFLGRETCIVHAVKYQEMWYADRNE